MANKSKKERSLYSLELLEVIFQRPFCRISHLEDAVIAKRKTANEYLYQLESVGIMRATKVGREVIFINQKILKILKA